MSMTARLGADGCWYPHCGEWIDRGSLDQDEIFEIEENGDAYYVCPRCGDSFYITNYD